MSAAPERSIATLPEQVAAMAGPERERFARLFAVTRTEGRLAPPPEMRAWIERAFGTVAAVERQRVVKVRNLWTLEGALFNDLRARRPIRSRVPEPASLSGDGADPFCHPLTGTPADAFGRVEGAHAVTASNVAKYDGLHGVVIFAEHDPLAWGEEQVVDAFCTAEEWLRRALAAQPQPAAVYPFVMWNCLPRSGASIVHAHMQVTLGEGGAYARVEQWRRAAEAYRRAHGASYINDLHAAHGALGLAGADGQTRWMAHLTPAREKEVVLLAAAPDDALFRAVHRLLRLWVDRLGVRAFNLAMYRPPLAPVPEDWSDFPVVVRMVDRGDPASLTSDVGAMELFAQPVVSSDPWKVADAIRAGLAE